VSHHCDLRSFPARRSSDLQVSIRVGQSSVGNLNRQLQIRDEGVEFAVSFDIVEVFTQCGSLFTPNGINIVQDTFETAIFIEHSRGTAGTNPLYPRGASCVL